MSEFYITISNEEMAEQVASLLNTHNNLYKAHNKYTISNGNIKYFIELVSSPAINKRVVGCVGLRYNDPTWTNIKHVCVDPMYRRFGVARKLIETAIAHSTTDWVYMTIREDNKPSLYLAKSLGFAFAKKEFKNDHFVITAARRR